MQVVFWCCWVFFESVCVFLGPLLGHFGRFCRPWAPLWPPCWPFWYNSSTISAFSTFHNFADFHEFLKPHNVSHVSGLCWASLGGPWGSRWVWWPCFFIDFCSQVIRLRPVGVPPGSHMSIHTYRHIPFWFVATSQSCFHSVGCIGSPCSMNM